MSNPMTLRPGEWKQNVLLNLAQLQDYVLSIPDMLEDGTAGIKPEHMAVADDQYARARLFMGAWARARFEAPANANTEDKAAAPPPNGAQVRKGGWPKGRSRKRRDEAGIGQ